MKRGGWERKTARKVELMSAPPGLRPIKLTVDVPEAKQPEPQTVGARGTER